MKNRNIKYTATLFTLLILLGGCGVHWGMPSFHFGGRDNDLPKHGDKLYVNLCASCHGDDGTEIPEANLTVHRDTWVVQVSVQGRRHENRDITLPDYTLTTKQARRLVAYVQSLAEEKE